MRLQLAVAVGASLIGFAAATLGVLGVRAAITGQGDTATAGYVVPAVFMFALAGACFVLAAWVIISRDD